MGIALGVLLLAVTAWFLTRPSETRLPDGSALSVEWISYGKTNVYVDGTLAEKVFGGLFQKTKIKMLAFIKPPTRKVFSDPEGVLSVRLRFKNTRDQTSFPNVQPRVFVADEATGHRYLALMEAIQISKDGRDWHAYLHMTAFPRTQKRLQLEVHAKQGKLLCVVSVKNPAYGRQEPVSLTESPSTIKLGDMDIAFGASEVMPNSLLVPDVPIATLNIKISQGGLLLTNWRITDTTFRDGYGNHRFINAVKDGGVDWQGYHFWGYLDPAHAWKVQYSVTQDADFAPDELCTFDVNYPLTTPKIEVCQGRKLQVDFVNTDMLAVNLFDTNANVRLTFIGATDQDGTPLFSGNGSWSQHRFWRGLEQRHSTNGGIRIESLKRGSVLRVTVAIHTNYPAEHVFSPHKVLNRR